MFTSWLGQSEKCPDKYVLAWPEDYKTARAEASSRKKKSTYGARKFKVRKSFQNVQDRLQEVQEVSKTCSGVGFGQQAHEHRGSKSGQWLGEIARTKFSTRQHIAIAMASILS